MFVTSQPFELASEPGQAAFFFQDLHVNTYSLLYDARFASNLIQSSSSRLCERRVIPAFSALKSHLKQI